MSWVCVWAFDLERTTVSSTSYCRAASFAPAITRSQYGPSPEVTSATCGLERSAPSHQSAPSPTTMASSTNPMTQAPSRGLFRGGGVIGGLVVVADIVVVVGDPGTSVCTVMVASAARAVECAQDGMRSRRQSGYSRRTPVEHSNSFVND